MIIVSVEYARYVELIQFLKPVCVLRETYSTRFQQRSLPVCVCVGFLSANSFEIHNCS